MTNSQCLLTVARKYFAKPLSVSSGYVRHGQTVRAFVIRNPETCCMPEKKVLASLVHVFSESA